MSLLLAGVFCLYNKFVSTLYFSSVGLSALVGMFLSIDKEMSLSLPAGKMLDMEATLSGAPDEFIMGTKSWFRLTRYSSLLFVLILTKTENVSNTAFVFVEIHLA